MTDKKTVIAIADLDAQLRNAQIQLQRLRDTINARFTKHANLFVDSNDEISLLQAEMRILESRLKSLAPKKRKFWFFKRK